MLYDDDLPAVEITQRGQPRPQPASTPPRRSALRRLAPLFVVLLVLAESVLLLRQHAATPSTHDWAQAAQQVAQARRAGEPVLFAPLWVEPVGRLHLGQLLELPLLTLSDVDRFASVWEVSIRGARHPWLRGLAPAQRWTFGRVSVARFARPAAQVLYDFTARISDATVERIGRDVTRCPRQGGRFLCDQQRSWNWVGPHLAEVGHRPYRCIFAHPVDGHVMRLNFTEVPLGRSLVGYTGIDDFENRKRAQGPVMLRIFAGPRLLATIHHVSDWPWRRFTLPTAELAGQTHSVRFEITAPQAYARTFCFSAEVRR